MVAPILELPNRVKTNGPLTSNQIGWLHSAESPLRGGFARSLTLASNNDPNYIASWFGFVGPEVRVRQVPGHLTAWTQGYGNPFGPGWEQEGYAAFTREQWLTPLGLLQLENLAQDMAEWARNHGVPARWLTTDEVQAVCFGGNRSIKGFAIHAQIANDRTDPGVNYPYDMLINRIAQINGGPRTTGPRPPAHIEENPAPDPKEPGLSQHEVKQIKDHINALVIHGYTTGGKKYAGLAPILTVNQREQRETNAIVTNLVTALNRVTAGEPFDEAKLLAGVRAAAAAGTAEAISSIETTVNLKGTP